MGNPGTQRRWFATVAAVRLPAAMAPLSLVLAGREATGSFAFGGVLAGVHAAAEALFAAPCGRLIDRLHAGRAAVAGLLAVEALSFAMLALGVAVEAPGATLVALTFVAAGVASGVPGALRAQLGAVVSRERLERALALDAVALEAVWIAAPVLAATLAAVWSPAAALAVMALAAAAAAAMAADPDPAPSPPGGPRTTGPIASLLRPRTILVLITSAAMGYAEGSIGVALPPLLEGHGHPPATAGPLLALLSLGSVLGGLLYGRLHRTWRRGPQRRADVLLAALAVGVLSLSQAGSVPQLAVAVLLTGLVIAPLNAARSYAMQDGAPPAREAEAFSAMYGAMGAGWGASGLMLGVLLGPLGAGGALALAGAATLAVAVGSLALHG